MKLGAWFMSLWFKSFLVLKSLLFVLFCIFATAQEPCQFSFVKVMWNRNSTYFWSSEILLKFWDFCLMFCMWPLNIPSNKCYITTWGQEWLLPWFLRWLPLRPSMRATESNTPWEIGLKLSHEDNLKYV